MEDCATPELEVHAESVNTIFLDLKGFRGSAKESLFGAMP